MRPPKPCLHRRCPEHALPGLSYCPEHQAARKGLRLESRGGWKRLRAQVIAEQNGLCARCKHPLERPEVHHIDGDVSNDSRQNLEALCASPCHREAEAELARRARHRGRLRYERARRQAER